MYNLESHIPRLLLDYNRGYSGHVTRALREPARCDPQAIAQAYALPLKPEQWQLQAELVLCTFSPARTLLGRAFFLPRGQPNLWWCPASSSLVRWSARWGPVCLDHPLGSRVFGRPAGVP